MGTPKMSAADYARQKAGEFTHAQKMAVEKKRITTLSPSASLRRQKSVADADEEDLAKAANFHRPTWRSTRSETPVKSPGSGKSIGSPGAYSSGTAPSVRSKSAESRGAKEEKDTKASTVGRKSGSAHTHIKSVFGSNGGPPPAKSAGGKVAPAVKDRGRSRSPHAVMNASSNGGKGTTAVSKTQRPVSAGSKSVVSAAGGSASRPVSGKSAVASSAAPAAPAVVTKHGTRHASAGVVSTSGHVVSIRKMKKAPPAPRWRGDVDDGTVEVETEGDIPDLLKANMRAALARRRSMSPEKGFTPGPPTDPPPPDEPVVNADVADDDVPLGRNRANTEASSMQPGISSVPKVPLPALMDWVMRHTDGYVAVDIKDFSESWRDGLAFCALLHSYSGPNVLDYRKLRPENAAKNLKLAFDVAEDVFDIIRKSSGVCRSIRCLL